MNKGTLSCFSFVLMLALAGCGDSNDNNSVDEGIDQESELSLPANEDASADGDVEEEESEEENTASNPDLIVPEPEFSVSGQVSGLTGMLSFSANEAQFEFTDSGVYQLSESFLEGSHVELDIIQEPENQLCTFSQSGTRSVVVEIQNTNEENVDIACVEAVIVSGYVLNYFDNSAISAATVSVYDGVNLVGRVDTNQVGEYTAKFAIETSRLAFNFDAENFGEYGFSVDIEEDALRVQADALLQPVHANLVFNPELAIELMVEGIPVVSLVSDNLVRADGSFPEGSVNAEITVIDPSSDVALMPGSYVAQNLDTGDESLIESFGAINVTFSDSEGESLQLAENLPAMIRIPLADNIDPVDAPATMPLFYFNEIMGFWIEEGTANLIEESGNWFYKGSVTHFTTWNADQVYSTTDVQGCVVDVENNPVSGVSILSSGQDYNGSAQVLSNAEGLFSVPARINSDVLVFATQGADSNVVSLSTGDEVMTLEECLVLDASSVSVRLSWESSPSDLDAHLFGPTEDSGDFHVYFGATTFSENATLIRLDLDDTDSFGPETISILNLFLPGDYPYFVKNYSGEEAIHGGNDGARVELNIQGETYVFQPPSGKTEDIWSVFTLRVDEDQNISLMVDQTWLTALPFDEANIGDDAEGEASAFSSRTFNAHSTPYENPAKKAVKKKYYNDLN